MQKAIVFILTTLILFSACGPSKEELAKREIFKNDSIAKALSATLEGILSDPCNGRDKDSTFKGLFNAFCPGDTSRNPPFCSFKKYPFDTVITKKKDTLVYFFKVSNVCCKKYYPNFTLNQDTLILSYNFCGTECDCDCDYYLTYKIPTKKYKFKHVVLRTDQIISRNTK
jgi:hypothetical protein